MRRPRKVGRDRGVLFGGQRYVPDGQPLTGFARFWELLDRDLSRFFLSNTPALAAGTLYGFGLWMGLTSRSILLTLLAGLLGGALLGPCLCGSMDAILRSLRDEPGFWWENYKKSWRQNGRQSALCGAVMGLVLAGQIFALWFQLWVGLTLVSMAVLICVFLYVYPQIVLVELGTLQVFSNAMVLALGHPKVTLRALLIAALWAFVLWLLWPLSVLAWAALGVWFPGLLILFGMQDLLTETFLDRDGE